MKGRVAVLSSGGLDSCVLLAKEASRSQVYPIYIQNGLIWEKEEIKALQSFLRALNNRRIEPLTILTLPVATLYGNHWSLHGRGIPKKKDPDSKTYLPGRNVLLLSLASIWCSLHEVRRIALGVLEGNPFSDATPDFFRQFGKTISNALDFEITIEAPFREKHKKEDLIRKFSSLPLELSLSCMAPKRGKHCGKCNKCHERQVGFQTAGVIDLTKYGDLTKWR